MKQHLILDKATSFGIRVVNMYSCLASRTSTHALLNQVLRSGTSVGANITEGIYAESVGDMIHKYGIARKEANETLYWLLLLKQAGLLTCKEYGSMVQDCTELAKMLTAAIKSLKLSANK